MKINFERLKEHLIERGEYDEEDILESIEKHFKTADINKAVELAKEV